MKTLQGSLILLLAAATCLPAAHAGKPSETCKAVRSFVASVQPEENREFTFRTSWGENFKDDPKPAMTAKRCEHGGYEPAKRVCDVLMEHGYTEFSNLNVQDTISCLSRKTRFAPLMQLNSGAFSFSYGSDHRGALIDITFGEDKLIGGMVFRLVAEGY